MGNYQISFELVQLIRLFCSNYYLN